MNGKNLFIILALISAVALSLVFFLYDGNASKSTTGAFTNDNLKKMLESIDRTSLSTSNSQQRICSTFSNKLTNKDYEDQSQIVKDTIKKLEDPKVVNKLLYSLIPKDLNDGYGSHAVPLTISALITNGDILELGIGKYSTVALNSVAKQQKKFLLSTESEIDWMNKFVHLNDTINHLILSSNSECAKSINMDKKWGMVFVDHLQAENRQLDMIKYADKAQIVVAHDSEKGANGYYHYDKAYPYFKFHCKYSLYLPNRGYISTSMLSNFIDFKIMEKILKSVDTSMKTVVCDQNLKRRK